MIAILGPTGTGKSELAAQVAERLNGEVINCDAFQMYAGMSIGTAQPDAALQDRVPHHGYGVLSPREKLSAGEFAARAEGWIAAVRGRGRLPVLCGGSGFYFEALVRPLPETPPRDAEIDARLGSIESRHAARPDYLLKLLAHLDPAAAAALSPRDSARIKRALTFRMQTGRRFSELRQRRADRPLLHPHLAFGLEVQREELCRRLEARTARLFESGLVEETAALLAAGCTPQGSGLRAIGYGEAAEFLAGRIGRDAALAATLIRTLQYAKRQRTWFRKTPDIIWLGSGVDFTAAMNMNGLEQVIGHWQAAGQAAGATGGG